MKLRIISACVVSAVSALLAANTFAYVHENGAYLEGNVGTNFASLSVFGLNATAFNSVGGNINMGYQLNRYLAPEIGYTYYGTFGINNVDVAIKGIIPFDNRVSIFGKLGLGYIFAHGDNAALPLLGAGISYAVSNKWDINAQAQGVTIGFVSIGLVSMGLTYHFD